VSEHDSGGFQVSPNADDVVKRAIDDAVARGVETGVQVAAYLKGKLVVDTWGGVADEVTGRKVDGDTLFNVYSATKAVAAVALHIQADRGLIDYNAPVTRYWPEYGTNGKATTTVRDVLTHRACVPQMPPSVTPERMCDWEWMTRAIAALEPIAPPGSKTLYLSMTFGWIVGELVRRTDPAHRSLGRFIREEVASPLGITDLWVGIPDSVESRIARQVNAMRPIPPEYLPPLFLASMPEQVALSPVVFERPDVRRAEVAGVGGIFNARSEARFWAMLANLGELDGVRLLSRKLAQTFNTPRAHSDEPDQVMFNIPLPISIGGFWLGGPNTPVCSPRSPRAICHPGQGGSIGWADPDTGLAVAICHNRLFNASTPEEDPILPIAEAVRAGLGL
jgi:CubicO group peptidase (beta-lactamase class C family)